MGGSFFSFNLLNFSYFLPGTVFTPYTHCDLQNNSTVRWFCIPFISQLPVICSTNNRKPRYSLPSWRQFPLRGNPGFVPEISDLEYAIPCCQHLNLFLCQWQEAFSYCTFVPSIIALRAIRCVFVLSFQKCWQTHFGLLQLSMWQKKKGVNTCVCIHFTKRNDRLHFNKFDGWVSLPAKALWKMGLETSKLDPWHLCNLLNPWTLALDHIFK